MEVQRKKVMSRWKYVWQTEQLSHEIFDMLPLIRTSLESWVCLIFYNLFPPFSFFNCSHLTVQLVSFWIRHKCTLLERANLLDIPLVCIFMREKNTAFSSWVKNRIEWWRIPRLWTQYYYAHCLNWSLVFLWAECDFVLFSWSKAMYNQVRSLDHFVVQNFGDFLCWKYKEVVCFYVSNLLQ